jgi:hypothetical protein
MTPIRIERLDSSHWTEIEDLYFACENAVRERAIAKGDQPTESEAVERTWQLWSNGMKRYYLVGDEFHYLYGIWDEKNIMQTMLGWRCDLPSPYNNDWVIVYMKSRPTDNSTLNFVQPLWRLMFEQCEARGFTKWHAIVSKDRYTKFDAFERRFTPEIHQRYKYETLVDIPPNTQPEIDWVWAMMGRNLLKLHHEVRTGTRIK